MGKLLAFLKGYEKESILGPLFKLLEATLELFVPLVVASLIDIGITNRDVNYCIKMFIVLVILGVVGLAFSLFDILYRHSGFFSCRVYGKSS